MHQLRQIAAWILLAVGQHDHSKNKYCWQYVCIIIRNNKSAGESCRRPPTKIPLLLAQTVNTVDHFIQCMTHYDANYFDVHGKIKECCLDPNKMLSRIYPGYVGLLKEVLLLVPSWHWNLIMAPRHCREDNSHYGECLNLVFDWSIAWVGATKL